MAVDNSNVIDLISTNKEGAVVLTISDHLEWDEDNEHLYLLQEKINTYLMAIESGQVNKSYPLSKNKHFIISVALKYEPDETGLLFFSKISNILSNAGYGFDYYVFK
jgi:hypothetical protein